MKKTHSVSGAFLAVLLISAWPLPARAADWPQFRGPLGTGVADEPKAPLKWDREKGVKWRAPLPGPGNGSPIVSAGRVFVQCAEDEGRKRSLFCFDRETGRELWVQTVDFGRVMPTHKTNPYCGSTPASDGKRVVVWEATAGAFCYGVDGKKIWSRDLGEFQHMWGYGSSPVIHDGKVILHCGPGRRVFLAALDLETGKTLWETDEPVAGNGERNEKGQYTGSWSTPVIVKVDGKDQIVCAMTTRVNGYDPADGGILWSCDGLKGNKGELAYSSPMFAEDVCVQVGGFGGPSIGFRHGGKGNITEKQRLWRTESNPQSIGSGVYVGRHLYIPDASQGTLRCLEPKTGEETWREKAGGPNFWGSIVMAAGRLYVTNQEGETVVFAPNPRKFEQLAANDLGEESNSTPAISDGEIFLRTFEALYCISEK